MEKENHSELDFEPCTVVFENGRAELSEEFSEKIKGLAKKVIENPDKTSEFQIGLCEVHFLVGECYYGWQGSLFYIDRDGKRYAVVDEMLGDLAEQWHSKPKDDLKEQLEFFRSRGLIK